jgi:tyrosine-specific transport protein
MSLMVTGNMVGAGILAMPVITGLSGLIPSLLGFILTWFLMILTALVISDQKVFAEDPDADLPTLFKKELNRGGAGLHSEPIC